MTQSDAVGWGIYPISNAWTILLAVNLTAYGMLMYITDSTSAIAYTLNAAGGADLRFNPHSNNVLGSPTGTKPPVVVGTKAITGISVDLTTMTAATISGNGSVSSGTIPNLPAVTDSAKILRVGTYGANGGSKGSYGAVHVFDRALHLPANAALSQAVTLIRTIYDIP